MINPPDPHPLDFDFRYDPATRDRLCRMLAKYSPVLCIGTPSVARQLESMGCDVTLLDRQPFQGVHNHLICDPIDFQGEGDFQTVLADPPWYPSYFLIWAIAAAHAVGIGGTIFLSLWPDETRPLAAAEANFVCEQIAKWGNVERNIDTLKYQIPVFELLASGLNGGPLSHSPLHGELVCVKVQTLPIQMIEKAEKNSWLRFVFDDYQLALKLSTTDGPCAIFRIAGSTNWRWPFVSARAQKREEIDLWSSKNEVAKVQGSEEIAAIFRELGNALDRDDFDRIIAQLPGIEQWDIPRPPYRRFAEWRHQQLR